MKKVRLLSVAVALVAVLVVSVWAVTQKVNLGASIGVAAVPVSSSAWSNELAYYFGNPSTTAVIVSPGLAYSLGTVSTNQGAFTIDSLRIRCGSKEVIKSWNGSGTLTIADFNGQPAKTTCYVAFYGKCSAGYTVAGQYVAQCNKSYINSNMAVNY